MTSISSQSENTVETELQKILKLLGEDVIKIKRELLAINLIVKADGPLSVVLQNANYTLSNIARKKGIDVENWMNAEIYGSGSDLVFSNRIKTVEVTQRIQQLLKEP